MSPDLLRLMILVVIFVAVLLGVERALSILRGARLDTQAINRRLSLISRGFSREDVAVTLRRVTSKSTLPPPFSTMVDGIERMLCGAGLKISAGSIVAGLVLLSLIIFLLLSWLIFLSGGSLGAGRILLAATFSVAAGLGLPLLVLARLADRRRKQLVEQFPVALDVFVRGLRAGHPVASALELVSGEMSDPIGSEFGLVQDEVTYGADLRDALQSMADRCGVEDMQMFVVSLSIQQETGGNLAEILENLSQVIRERAAMLMKVRALSSEGRMTALILTLLPVGSFVGLFLTNPGFYLDVADDPMFVPGFAGLLLAFAIGVFWIRKLIDLKV
jgi:tight adherence protein B